MNIYVGNLPFSVTEDNLRDLFAEFGEVISSKVIIDRDTGRSRGFGFIEMGDNSARNAISELDGAEYEGNDLKVNEARPRNQGFGGGGGGNRNRFNNSNNRRGW